MTTNKKDNSNVLKLVPATNEKASVETIIKPKPFSRSQLAIFIAVFALIGGLFIYKSFASVPLGSALPARMPLSSGTGGTFYVDGTNGNDASSGSASAPWKTINKALGAVPVNGSIIKVKPGTYYSSPGNYVINYSRAGNASDPITLMADQTGTVFIQNSNPTGWTLGAWIHDGANGLRVQGLSFKLLNNLGAGGSSDIQIEGSDNVEFYNNTFNEVAGMGIVCKGGKSAGITSDNIWVLGNSFRPSSNNAYAQVTGLGDVSNSYYGSKGSHWMYVGQFGSNPTNGDWNQVNGCNRMVIANNTFVGAAAGRHVQLGPELRNSYIVNNTFFGNKSVQTIGYGNPSNDASAVYAGQGVQFFNNTSNTQYSTGNNVVTNNIFMNLYGHAVSGSGSTMVGNLVQNNLSFGLDNNVYNGTQWDGDSSLDYMYYYGTTASTLFSTGSGNLAKADPLFADPLGFDYRLKAGSPAATKADPAYAYPTDKNGVARSSTPSLGAYEPIIVSTTLFGVKIPLAPAFPASLPERVVTNWTDLQSAVATGNIRVKVSGRINIPVDWRWTKPNVWVYGDPAGGAALIGGSIKINTSDVWVSNLEIYGGTYDGVKLGDGAVASRIVIVDNWIHDVGDQGVLIAGNGAQDVWIIRNRIEKVNLTENPSVQADGHGVYTGGYGGVTKRIYILSNEIHPAAFGVQAYPEPDDVVVSGNSIIGGDDRGGIVWYSGAKNVKAVGNLIVDAPSAGFEVDSGGATITSGNRADENVCLRCKLWATGYSIPPGSGNISTNDQIVADSFRVRSDQWGWLSPFLLNGSARSVANVGSNYSGLPSTPPPPSGSITTKPSIPTGLVATTGDKQVVLKWTASPSSEQVDYYQVYWTTDNAWSVAPQQNLTVSGTSYTVSGLTNNINYNFRVSAHNSGGYGDWTTAVSSKPTPPPPSSTAPSITQSISSGQTLSGTVNWTVTTSATNIAKVSFDMDYDKTLTTTDTTAPFRRSLDTTKYASGSHVLGLTITLSDGTVVWQPYQIGTVNFSNTSATPPPTSPPPPPPSADITPPSTPGNFRVTATGKSNVTLAWNTSTDNVGVAGYKLYRDTNTTPIYNGSFLSITNTGLSTKSSYSYYVVATDKAGNTSTKSSTICVGKWGWWNSITRSRSWSYC